MPDIQKIADAIKNASSPSVRNLNYHLDGDNVRITGQADSIAAKQQAFHAITAVVGDVGLMNGIEVGAAPAPVSMAPAAPAAAAAAAPIDIDAFLSAKAADSGEDLDWKHSMVDLMKLVGMDSSLSARKSLAGKLGYSGSTDDTVTMNQWLHGQLLEKLAANGGNVPAGL